MSAPDDRPRVVIASRIYLPEPAAASFRLDNLARALVRAGALVEVLTTTTREAPGPDPEGTVIRRVPALRDAAGYIRGYLPYLSFDAPLAVRLLAARRPDAVVCEPPPTTGVVVRAICTVRRVPYAYYAGDVWADAMENVEAPDSVRRLATLLERWAMNGAATILAVSPGVESAIRRLGVTAPVSMVGNGVDTETLVPDGPTAGSDRTFVYPGTASEVHGALLLVDAFEQLLDTHSDARLVFIGQGSDLDAVSARAQARTDGAISVLPRMAAADVARWMRGAAATLASVRPGPYDFAFPSKAYAAAACGARVIMAAPAATRAPVADGGLGWAVDYDVDAVRDAMTAALEQPDTAADRERRAAWVRENASLRAAAERAAQAVLGVLRRS